MNIQDKDGKTVILQPTAKPVTDLATKNFKKKNSDCFIIKNDNENRVLLSVRYLGQIEFVSTYFLPGWNEDTIVEIESNAVVANLLYSL